MTLHFADAEELAKSGGKLLSARGHLMADKRTNRLLIRDDARHLPALKAWAQEMDLPVGQGGAGRPYRVDERNQPS